MGHHQLRGADSVLVTWLMAVVAIALSAGNNILLLLTGAKDMPAGVTTLLSSLPVSMIMLIAAIRRLRKKGQRLRIERPMIWPAIALGSAMTLTFLSNQEAVRNAPYAMVTLWTFVAGPMVVALWSGRRQWRIVVPCVAVSAAGAILVSGTEMESVSLVGMLCILTVGICYWIQNATNARVAKMDIAAGEAVFVISALGELFTIPILAVVFFASNGPAVISEHSPVATLGAVSIGLVAAIGAQLAARAWQRGLTSSDHAMIQPFKTVFGALFGLAAGQKPADFGPHTICGYALVLSGAITKRLLTRGDAKTPERTEPPQ